MQQTFILMGMSGCGKGTQGKLLEKHMNGETLYIQVGGELREFIKGDTYTQRLCADIYDRGGLTPEFLATHMWTRMLIEDFTGKQNLIIDGSPRRLHEAGTLHSIFEFYSLPKPYVVYFEMDKDEALKRLMQRKRMDDNEEDIRERLSWFDTHVMPTVRYYEHNPHYHFIKVNAVQSIEKVFSDILEQINGHQN